MECRGGSGREKGGGCHPQTPEIVLRGSLLSFASPGGGTDALPDPPLETHRVEARSKECLGQAWSAHTPRVCGGTGGPGGDGVWGCAGAGPCQLNADSYQPEKGNWVHLFPILS